MTPQIYCDPLTGKLLNSAHKFEIDTDPCGTTNFVELKAGIANETPAMNEVVDQTPYLDGEGYGSSDVTGKQLIIPFTGHRVYGDPAQDFIYDVLEPQIGEARKTNFRWTDPIGTIKQGIVTVANIENSVGDVQAKGDISFEIHFNGKPATIPVATINPLSIVSTSVIDGDTGVSVSAPIDIVFNNEINFNSVSVQSIALKEEGVTGNVLGQFSISIDKLTVTFTADSDLSATTDYTFVIDGVVDKYFQKLPAMDIIDFTTV